MRENIATIVLSTITGPLEFLSGVRRATVLLSLILPVSLIFLVSSGYSQERARQVRTLIVIFDGLRPDYITPDAMPYVNSLKSKGAYGRNNHSVFPTVTRVNASSYATGSYPAKHGLLGNTVYFPGVDRLRGLDTGDANVLMRIDRSTGDSLLTATSLGELLQSAGSQMMVFSSGSSGQAFLQNHKVGRGAVVNPEIILPRSLKEDLEKKVGAPPPASKPNTAQHDWATRALLEYGLGEPGPLVTAIWYSDPDATAHSLGMGHPLSMEAIKSVDEQFGIVMKALETRNLLDSFNIIITSDHGFVTHTGSTSISDFLIQKGLKSSQLSEDVVVAGNAIFVKDHDAEVIKHIVSVLQEQQWVGAIFTKAEAEGSSKGWVEGTLSFQSIHWNHARAGDVLVDYNWNHAKNNYGYEGTSYAKGTAGHGGSSPYEIHIPLIASGPSFRRNFESVLPTSNIDIVPTVLHLSNLSVPPSMDGRIMYELLAIPEHADKPRERIETLEASVNHTWGTYKVILQTSVVGRQRYIDYTKVERHAKDPVKH